MTTTVEPVTITIDLDEVTRILERIQPQIAHEDHAQLVAVAEALAEATKLVRDRGTTIARLRRLFGLTGSEKTDAVCGSSSDASSGSQPATASDKPADDGDHDEVDLDDDGGRECGEHEPKRRKGHGRIAASAYSDARHIPVEHSLLHAGDMCPGCACGKLHPLSEPARILRIFGQAPLAATCWDCERLRCGGCGEVFTARAPAEAQGPKYTESAAAMMALLRYGAGMPLNRLDHLQSNCRTPVPATTQWEVVRDRAESLRPVYDELLRIAANARVLHNDDTHARILALMGKRRAELLTAGELPDPERTGLFTTGIVADTDCGLIALFFTGRKHAGENLTELLDGRDPKLDAPIQMCDGLARNLPDDHAVLIANCLAHGRRHVVDEVDNFPAECRHVLEQLRIVFHNESRCDELGLTPEQRLELHQKDSGPVMQRLRAWIEAELEQRRVEPNSGLGGAYRYLLDRWDRLTLFLRVAGAPIDNNICERALKMAIRHRNNSMFYRSERGAEVGDLYMSLIFTTDLHAENAFEYLSTLFEHEREVAAAPGAWLPWTFRATLAALEAPRAA